MTNVVAVMAKAINDAELKWKAENGGDNVSVCECPDEVKARAAIDALWTPTEAMWGGLARDLVMWDRGMPNQYGSTLYKHLRATGRPIPTWLIEEIPDVDHTPPKGTVAVCIFKAMLDAALGSALSEDKT